MLCKDQIVPSYKEESSPSRGSLFVNFLSLSVFPVPSFENSNCSIFIFARNFIINFLNVNKTPFGFSPLFIKSIRERSNFIAHYVFL